MQQFLQLSVNALAIGSVYAMIAISLEIAFEATGVVNFATGQLVTIGALLGATSVNLSGFGMPVAYLIVVVAMGLIGLAFFAAVYLPLRKQPALTIIIGTVGVGIFIQNVGQLIWGPLPIGATSPFGAGNINLFGVVVARHAVSVILITLLLMFGVYLLLYRSPVGSRVRAMAQDAETARLMGLNVNGLYAFTWALVCALAGVAGLLLAPMWFVDSGMGDSLSLKAFAAAVIGGFGSIPGAICGGILVGLAEILGAAYISSAYKDALVFAAMLLFLVLRPQGLFGERIAERG